MDAQVEALDLTRDDALGRPTVARALVAAGHATSVEDAFERILSYGMPGYVPRQGLGPVEAIRCHPRRRRPGVARALPRGADAISRCSGELRAEGLNGIESHHRSFDAAARQSVSAVARELGLVRTGGTDYHGDLGPYAGAHAGLVMPEPLVTALRAAIGR